MANVFFCTRCGVKLDLDQVAPASHATCPRCRSVVATPYKHNVLPIASLADVGLTDIAADIVPEQWLDVTPSEDAPDEPYVMSEEEMSEVSSAVAAVPLGYASAPVTKQRGLSQAALDALAERLANVLPDESTDASRMTNCPHCGSTIAPFVGKCPFCRHPLRGR